jgi:membrane associated rhomboid family serine protease
MNYYRQSRLSSIPPVVKNILIINVLFFAATYILEAKGINLTNYLGLHYFKSDLFQPYQIITHMFMHGGLMHIAFNMYALWMFGKILEQVWGPKKFLIYYMITGLGAATLHLLVMHFQIVHELNTMPADRVTMVLSEGAKLISHNMNFNSQYSDMANLNMLYNGATVGASGAVFGLLLAFGMLFPNVELYLMFIPMPIKAKYFVMGYGAIELFSGVANRAGDNTAHFAHLGGMLFGFILIKMWKKKGELY